MIKITLAQNKDRFFLSEVCKDARKLYDDIMPGAFEKQAKKFIEEGLPQNYEVGIINVEDKKVGFVGFVKLDNEYFYLTALYLLNRYQRQGYGKKILEIIEKDVYREGTVTIVLLVHSKATWALDFYKKNGFEVIENEENRIKKIANYRLSKYFLPSTVLMGKRIRF